MAIICNGNIEVDIKLFNKKLINNLMDELTFIDNGHFIQDFRIKNKKIYIPREFGIQYFGENKIKDYTSIGEEIDFRFKKDIENKLLLKNKQFTPVRKIQNKTLKKFLSRINKKKISKSGILHAYCGIGKTVMFWKILAEIKLKTILIFHETGIRDQAIKSAKKFLNIKNSDIGIIQGNKCEYKDKKICFAMIQTLINRKYTEDFYNEFGILIFDEVHHSGAKVFRNVTQQFTSKYRLGVTATPRGKNWKVVENHFGSVLTHISRKKQKKENKIFRFLKNIFNITKKDTIDGSKVSINPHVYFINTQIDNKISCNTFPEYISSLSNIDIRNDIIVSYIERALNENRKPIILSGRKQHLIRLEQKLNNFTNNIYSTGLYIGKMTQKELEKSKTKDCIFAINNKAFEGFNDPKRDTLFMCLPDRIDIEQAVGRIQRIHPGKKDPLVIDFCDTNIILNGKEFKFKEFAQKRNDSYLEIGCEIN